jgi:cytochrome c oxidase assembly protein subunit 15
MKGTFESGVAAPVQKSPETTPVWLRRFTKLVAASTLFLIFAGAMVTSTGSGLAVPDWPNTYGWFMFSFPLSKMVGGIFYEHGHRLIASTVGLLTIIQAIWLQRREPRRHVRILGWLALATVIIQGLLGGLTVLFLLPQPISIAHAGLAEIFFGLTVTIAFFTSRLYTSLRTIEKGDAPVAFSSLLVVLVYTQILIGAVMRHRGAGLAIPDFPLAFGQVIPPFTSMDIVVNFAHRVGAVVIAACAIFMLVRLRRFEERHPLRQIALGLVLLVPLQILLGGYTVLSGKSPVTTSLHVMTGAFTFALTLLLALTARTVAWRRVPQRGQARSQIEVHA